MSIVLETISTMVRVTDPFRFARELTRRREAAKLTQEALAQEVSRLGGKIVASRIAQLEDTETALQSGEPRKTGRKNLDAICEALDWPKNEARALLGVERLEDEEREFDEEEFAYALHGYKQLDEDAQQLIKDTLSRLIEYCLHSGGRVKGSVMMPGGEFLKQQEPSPDVKGGITEVARIENYKKDAKL